jgi:broad specificity phosphatase PhoE
MKIYFLRHGKYQMTTPPSFPTDDVELEEEAKSQIGQVAKLLAGRNIEKIISSPMTRTRQTADIVAAELGLDVEESHLFRERIRTKELAGKPRDIEKSQEIIKTINDNYHDESFKYKSEENFLELKKRVSEGLEFLLDREEEKLLVITHAEVLAMTLAQMIIGNDLDSYTYVKIRDFFFIAMGMPILTEHKNGKWRLMQFNVVLEQFAPQLV